jgi:outer membrane protein TolC
MAGLVAGMAGLVAGTLLVAAPTASAQPGLGTADTLRLTLDETVDRARTESFPVQSAEAEARAARARKRQSLAAFLPKVEASEQFVATTDPLQAFGLKLKQETVTQSDFRPARLNDPEQIDNFRTQVEVRQPLVNVDRFYERRAASRASKAAAERTDRTRAAVTFQARKGYFGLVLAERRVAVIDSALAAARANRKRAEDLFDEGLLNRADVLSARVRVLDLEQQRTDAAAERDDAADRLRVLLGVEDDVHVEAATALNRVDARVGEIDVAAVNRSRSDMQALRYRAEAARAKTQSSWLAFVPRVNAFGRYEWNDDRAFGTAGEGWTAGASLTWSLFKGFRQIGSAQEAEANQARAEVALRQQALQNDADIRSARRALTSARQRIDQTRAAVEQAEESLRIRSDRYAEGLAQTSDVLRAEADLARSRLALAQAIYDYNVAVYRLEFLTERSFAR